ncbi:unnamed protein product, partial [Staurois parvus]
MLPVVLHLLWWFCLHTFANTCVNHSPVSRVLCILWTRGRTDNSWGPQAIGNHGAPVSLPKLKKAYEKRYQGHLMGPPTDSGPSGSDRVSKWSGLPLLWT